VLIQRLLYQHAIVDTRILTTEYWFWTADLPLITNTESGPILFFVDRTFSSDIGWNPHPTCTRAACLNVATITDRWK